MSEYPQDGGSVCCCYDYCVDTGLQLNCVVHCILRVISCVMAGACHAEQEHPQDGSHGKWRKICKSPAEFLVNCKMNPWLSKKKKKKKNSCRTIKHKSYFIPNISLFDDVSCDVLLCPTWEYITVRHVSTCKHIYFIAVIKCNWKYHIFLSFVLVVPYQ